MKKSMNAGFAGLVVLLAGCAGGSTQQLQMSGVDPNYPHAGVISGEDGKGLIYSSDWKRVKEDEGAADPATEGMSAEEKAEYQAWKQQKDAEEFEAWKKAQQDQQGGQAEGPATP